MTANTQICPHCETPVADENRFCPGCGRIIEAATANNGGLIRKYQNELSQKLEQHKQRLGLSAQTNRKTSNILLQDIAASDLGVSLQTMPFVNYALYHVGIGIIQELTIKNHSFQPSQNLNITIQLLPNDYGEAWTANIPMLSPNEIWSETNIRLPLSHNHLRTVVEKETASLKITITDRHETLWTKTQKIDVLAYNQWLFVPEFMQLLGVFVQSNDPAIHPVIQAAAKHQESIIGSNSFPGYQEGRSDKILAMLKSIHSALSKDFAINYINPPPSYSVAGQKIRLVSDTLKQKRGTCLDLAILQAAIWEHIGLYPVIIVIPGHAFMACWMEQTIFPKPVIDITSPSAETSDILEALKTGKLLPINSTEVALGYSFDQAIDTGYFFIAKTLGLIEETKPKADENFLYLIDITCSRNSNITPLP